MRKTRQPKTNWQSGSLLTMTAERQLKGEMYEITSIVMSHHWNCFIQPQVSCSHTSRDEEEEENYQCFLFLFLRGLSSVSSSTVRGTMAYACTRIQVRSLIRDKKRAGFHPLDTYFFFFLRAFPFPVSMHFCRPSIPVFFFFWPLDPLKFNSKIVISIEKQLRGKNKNKVPKKKNPKKLVNCLLNFLHNLLFKLSLSIGINSAQLSNMSLSRNLKKKKRKKVNNLWVDPSYFFFPRQRTNTCWNDSDRTSTRCFTHGILKEKENTQ